jgi:hypothetical protein
LRWPRDTLSAKVGGCLVGIVRLQTKATEFFIKKRTLRLGSWGNSSSDGSFRAYTPAIHFLISRPFSSIFNLLFNPEDGSRTIFRLHGISSQKTVVISIYTEWF